MALQPACPLVEAWGITDRGDCSPAGHPSLVVAGGTAPCTVPATPSQPDRGHSDPSIPLQPDALCILTPCIRRATLRFMPPTHPTAPPLPCAGGGSPLVSLWQNAHLFCPLTRACWGQSMSHSSPEAALVTPASPGHSSPECTDGAAEIQALGSPSRGQDSGWRDGAGLMQRWSGDQVGGLPLQAPSLPRPPSLPDLGSDTAGKWPWPVEGNARPEPSRSFALGVCEPGSRTLGVVSAPGAVFISILLQ